MKVKLMVILSLVAACVFGDRTANRKWVNDNFPKCEKNVPAYPGAFCFTNNLAVYDPARSYNWFVASPSGFGSSALWVEDGYINVGGSWGIGTGEPYFFVNGYEQYLGPGDGRILIEGDLDTCLRQVQKQYYEDDICLEKDISIFRDGAAHPQAMFGRYVLENEYISVHDDNIRLGESGLCVSVGTPEITPDEWEHAITIPKRDGTLALLEDLDDTYIKRVKKEGYETKVCFTNALSVFYANQEEPAVVIERDFFRMDYFSVGEDFVTIGTSGLHVSTLSGELSADDARNWMSFPKGKSGTIALIEDITPALVLEKIKAMDETQLAELKTFLGVE